MRSSVGVSQSPPNGESCPKPTSSQITTMTFGAPAGGRLGAGHAGEETSSVRPITPGNG